VRLREKLGASGQIQIWEKARGAGGRYTTSRNTYPDGLKADMGAQYASVDPQDAESVAIMKSIVESGAAELVNPESLSENAERPSGFQHYRGVEGQNGIVKAMLSASNADVVYERRVSKLDLRGSVWRAQAYDGATEEFDFVLFCVPGVGPGGDNLNKIHGSWEKCLTNDQWKCVETPHDCRYSVAMWLEAGHQKSLSAFFENSSEKKVNSSNIELLFWQSRKDGEPIDGPQVIVAHTAQGAKGNKGQVEPRIINEALSAIGIQNKSKAVTSKKIITWFQSQVLSTNSSKQCVVASRQPALVLAGDYCTASTFTGCVKSASAAVSEIVALQTGKKLQESGTTAKVTKTQEQEKPQANKTQGQEKRWGKPQAQDPASTTGGYPSGKSRDSQQKSQKDTACSYCKKKNLCFKDESDGAWYCAPCWKQYYGEAPWAGA
jgi:renalase